MDTSKITFGVKGQALTYKNGVIKYASNTQGYIFAEFELDENWKSFDSVVAFWESDYASEMVDINPDGVCEVPAAVLTKQGRVFVNLVGTMLEGGQVTGRLTTYPLVALIIESDARIGKE